MNTMAKTILDKAIEAVPKFGRRIKLFTEKMRIAQYADNSIYDYRLKGDMKHPTVVLPPQMLSDYYGERCRFLYGFVCILCDAQLFSKQFDMFPKIGNG